MEPPLPASMLQSRDPDRLEAARNAPREAWQHIYQMRSSDRELFFGGTDDQWNEELHLGKSLCKVLVDWARSGPSREVVENCGRDVDIHGSRVATINAEAMDLLNMEKRANAAFRIYKDTFPTSIWYCCRRFCFTSIAIDPEKIRLFEELRLIHDVAEQLHSVIKPYHDVVETRRSGTGGSYIGFSGPSRRERERHLGVWGWSANRKRSLRRFTDFALKVLPFLYGNEDAPSGTKCPSEKLCTEAICALLGVSRKFLYGRKRMVLVNAPSNDVSDQDLSSIIDESGTRLRQRRRVGDRAGYPSIEELPTFDCGCGEPCLGGLNIVYLTSEYRAFSKCSKQLNPRQKENRYPLNVMFSPLSNSATKVCHAALSALYTVSKGHISDVRAALEAMCSDPDIDHRDFIEGGVDGYRKHNRHPMNRYPDHIREKVENHLDMVLRADPAGGNGLNICRVYSPEVNTKEKLRNTLRKALDEDAEIDEELSDSTSQRMVNKYLEARKCRIQFSQSDHNACPNCKTLNYAVLQFHYEAKQVKQRYDSEFGTLSRPFDEETQRKSESILSELAEKQYQENERCKRSLSTICATPRFEKR